MSILTAADGVEIDAATQRRIFGSLPTGVTAITSRATDGAPRGLVVGTFQSLSLDPPLVTFCVDKSSSTWPTLRTLGKFTANILATDQTQVCKALSRKGDEKFHGVEHIDSPIGTPRILGAAAWIDCAVLSEIVAGDHYMIVGSIEEIAVGDRDALIFSGGGFGGFAPLPTAPEPTEPAPTMLDRVTDAWTKAWSNGDTTAFAHLTAAEYQRVSKSGPEGIDEVVRQIEESHRAFSDFHVTVRHAIEDDNLVAIHWETSGTHVGEYMGVPPTGRTVTVSGASFIRHKGGLITAESVVWDPREMLSSMSIWHLGDQRSQRRKVTGRGN